MDNSKAMNSLSNQAKVDPVYSKLQPVFVKSTEKGERQRELRITVELHTGVGPLGRQVLSLQLTDDEDPYLLCSLLVTEEDFKSLKVEQGLLVDFDHFPSQLIRLLEECCIDRERTGSRFNLILNEDPCEGSLPRRQTSLQFVETNEFKHLCHLSLRILPGSDNEIKKHMAVKIKQLKNDLNTTTSALEQKSQMLNMAYEKLENKKHELEENRVRIGEEKSSLERRVLQEASEAREALSRAHLEWQRRLERERQDLEDQRMRETKNLEEQVSELKCRNQLLSEKLLQTESSVRDLAKHADSVEKELKTAQKEVSTLRKQTSKIDLDYHEKEKVVNSLLTKVAVLEQELKDKNLLIHKHQELLQVANEQKSQLEECVASKDASLERRNVTVKTLSDDLAKANKIISKQISDMQALSGKLKMKTEVVLKQEAMLSTKDKGAADLTAKVISLESKVTELESAIKEAQASLAVSKEQLSNKDEDIKKNENLINFLTRQLKEAEAKGNFVPRSSGLNSLLTSNLSHPATSTPNIGASQIAASLLGGSSLQNQDNAEVYFQLSKENARSSLRQKLKLPETFGAPPSDKPKSPLVPLREEEEDEETEAKELPRKSAIGGAGDQQKKAPSSKYIRPSRHIPTSTTPVVKRTDILSSYFPRS